jgi:hypothetical protein
MAFFVPLDDGAACARANAGKARANAEAISKASVARGIMLPPFFRSAGLPLD